MNGGKGSVDELKEKIAELSDFVEIYSTLTLNSIIFSLDRKGNFISVEKEGKPFNELKGKTFLSIVCKEDKKNAADNFMKCLGGEKIQTTIKIEEKSGEKKRFIVIAIPKRRDKKVERAYGIAREEKVILQDNFEKVINRINEPMCIADLLGNINMANYACAALFGYEKEEIAEKNIFDFIDEENIPLIREAITGNCGKKKVYIVNREGVKIPAEIEITEIEDSEKLLFIIKAISLNNETVGRTEEYFQKFKEKLSKVCNLNDKSSRQETYDNVIHTIMNSFDADSCFLGILSDGAIEIVASEGGKIGEKILLEKESTASSAATSNKEIYEPHSESGSKIYVPLSFNKKVLGVIGVTGKKPDAFSEDDRLLLNLLSRNVAKSIVYLDNEASLGKYKEIINKATEGIYITTFDGKILEVNPAFMKIFGYEGRKDELEKINAEQLFLKSDDRKKFLEILEKDGIVQNFETRYVTRNKKIFFGRESAWVVYSGENRIVEGILQDVTQQRKIEEDIKFYNSLLRHDIYNKNEIAIGYLGLLKNSDLSDKSKGIVDKATTAITEGNKLIESVKKLETIRDKKKMTNIDLDEVMERIIGHYSEEAKKRNIEIRYRPTGAIVRGNELIEDVFSNLIKNAIEHSCGHHVDIYAEDDEKGWNIYIEDDGVGIPQDNKEKIFQQGWKGKESRGSGLGLYLVKKIVEGFDGKIQVKSGEDEYPEGTRFIVWLKKGKKSKNNDGWIIGCESETLGVRW
ncbi:MAG: PAS domain S-box protein [Candidatus Thermoplasmatota archaeon]|nr:PAS domain S-box protein [Candidatus Thermoplasmatota archaeon]